MKRTRLIFYICSVIFFVMVFSPWLTPAEPVMLNTQSSDFVYILDAGHGGEDGGASSESGIKESDINLSIVLRLDQLMGFCGRRTLLTRTDDRSIHDLDADTIREKKVSDLRNRVKLAESIDRRVLISVHQNSYPDGRYRGAQVFYGPNAGSQEWGEATQEFLRIALATENTRKAKKIPETVYLMNKISCPAILVECGFLSNREEALQLLDSAYQKKIAAALTASCLNIDPSIQTS